VNIEISIITYIKARAIVITQMKAKGHVVTKL
jgi:hypothetical protein